MKLYAVSYIDWFDHKLITEFVSAPSDVEALLQWEKTRELFGDLEEASLEDLKQAAFDSDAMVNSVEVPNEVSS